jgi:hypothetical protein
MGKKLILGFALILLCVSIQAQAAWQWAKSISGTGIAEVICVITAPDNSIYVAGDFTETVTIGETVLVSAGAYDAYVAKLDTNGNWLWAVQCGGTGWERITNLAVDAEGNLWMSGYYNQAFSFGTFPINPIGNYDIFVAKLSQQRTWLGATGVGSTYDDGIGGLAIAPDGSVYLAGEYRDSITFGTNVLTDANGNIFVAKYDSNLNNLWAMQPNNHGNTLICDEIGTDLQGNFYLLGSFMYQCTFGTTSPITIFSQQMDAYVAKFTSNGTCVWADKVGTGSNAMMHGFVASDGSCYLTCDYVAFPAGQNSSSRLDIAPAVAKVNSSGIWQWYEEINDLSYCLSNKVAADIQNNCYLGGDLVGNQTFGDDNLTGDFNNWNLYVAKASPSGVWQWGLQTFGGGLSWEGAPYLRDIAAVEAGNCVVVGSYDVIGVDFGTLTLPPAQNNSAFIAKAGTEPSHSTDLITPELVQMTVYPNPAYGKIKIEFELDRAQQVGLSIYNIKGQLVKRFPQQVQPKGRSLVEWDGNTDYGRPAKSGIYIIKLDSDRGNTTRLIVRK